MKAISLWQPWATLIAIGAKRIETRGWATSYRGPLAIHAAKKMSPDLSHLTWFTEPFASVLHANGIDHLPRGYIVATCNLVACRPTDLTNRVMTYREGDSAWPLTEQERAFGDYSPNRWAWLLADVKPLVVPAAARGAQGLFDWMGELANA